MNRTNRKNTNRRNVTPRRVKNTGVVRLTLAADSQVGDHSAEIAKSLLDAAVKGNASSARLLIELAEGAEWVQDPETVGAVLNIVEKWKTDIRPAGPVLLAKAA